MLSTPPSRTDDLAAVREALGRMQRASGLPVVFGGLVEGAGLRLTELVGTNTEALRGLAISTGTGLGGKVVALRQAVAVRDYLDDRGISHEYDQPVLAEGLRAILAVPVLVDRSAHAVLYGAVREPLPLGTRTLDAALGVAQRLEVELRVRREVARRLAELESAHAPPPAEVAAREELREAHAELRSIAAEVREPHLRERLRRLSDRLAVRRPGQGRAHFAAAPALSPRELDVLACVAVGCGNAEAASRLGVRPETVKSYLASAMRKLGTHTRLETVVAARRAGLLP